MMSNLQPPASDEIPGLKRRIEELEAIVRDSQAREVATGRSEALFQNIIDSLDTPVFTLDRRYRYTGFNQSHAAVIKGIYGREIGLGTSLLDVMTVGEDRETAKRHLDRALAGERFTEAAFSGEASLSRPFFEVSHNPILDGNGEVTGVAVFAIEATRLSLLMTILDNLPVMVYLKDADNRLVLLHEPKIPHSKEECAESGDQGLEKAPSSLRSAEDDRADADILRTGCPQYAAESEIRTADGQTRWRTTTRIPLLHPSGKSRGLVCLATDITARKRTERDLRVTEGKFFRAFHTNPDALCIARMQDGVLLEINEGFTRTFGYGPEEAIGRSSLPGDLGIWLSSEDRGRYMEALKSRGAVTGLKVRFRRRDGQLRIGLASAGAFDIDGVVCVQSIVRDVTEEDRSAAALRESEAALRLSEALAHVGHWSWDLVSNRVVWSDEMKRIFGRDPGSLADGQENVLRAAVHPEDRARSVQGYRAFLEHGRSEPSDCRIVRPDGSVRLIRFQPGERLVSGEGKVVRLSGILQDITDLRRMEGALRESEEKYARAFHANPDAVSIARFADGVYLDVNEGFTRTVGYSREEVIGRSSLPGSLGIWLREEDRTLLQSALEGSGEATGFQVRFRRRDGAVRVGRISASLLSIDGTDCVQSIMRDVTEEDASAALLRESEERFRSLFDNSYDAILLTIPDGAILNANPSACLMLGRREEELRRLGRQGIVDPEDPRLSALLELRNRTGAARGELAFLRSDGKRFPGEVSTVLFRDREGCLRSSMIIRDLSEREKAQDALREKQRLLLEAQRKATLGVLIPVLAHEINNPNHIIQLNAGLLAGMWESLRPLVDRMAVERDALIGGIPMADARIMLPNLVNGIREAAERIGAYIQTLRDHARPDEGDDVEDVDLNLAVTSALTLCSVLISRSTRRFSSDLPQGLPPIRGRMRRIEQVAINLIINACQALTDPGQSIRVCTEHDAAAGFVRLVVRDEGRGMDRDCLPRIREPFFTTRLADGGSGLGIPISDAIVREHGGTLEFLSEPGRGMTVTAAFPAAGAP